MLQVADFRTEESQFFTLKAAPNIPGRSLGDHESRIAKCGTGFIPRVIEAYSQG